MCMLGYSKCIKDECYFYCADGECVENKPKAQLFRLKNLHKESDQGETMLYVSEANCSEKSKPRHVPK